MKTALAKKYLVIALVSVLLSLGIIRWHAQNDVPFCVNSAGCSARETMRGKVTTTSYGFPSTYRQVEKFNPDNTNPQSGGYGGYVQAEVVTEHFSIFKIITNIIFWFALLHYLIRFIPVTRRKQAATTEQAGPELPLAAPEVDQPQPDSKITV